MEGNVNKNIYKNLKPKQEVMQKLEVLEKNVENKNNENNNESENNNSKEPKKELNFEVSATTPKIIYIQPK